MTAVVLGLVLPSVTGRAAAAPARGWSTTATRAVSVPGTTDAGPLAGDTLMRVTVALGLGDMAEVRDDIAARVHLTPAEVTARFAPDPGQVGSVVADLDSAGFTGVSPTPDRLAVYATGTVAHIDAAFDTTLDAVTLGGRRYYTNVAPASVPAAIGGTVVAVLGLDDLPTVRLAPATATSTVCTPTATGGSDCLYHPDGLVHAYNASTVSTGSGTSIAVFSAGDVSQVLTDFATERADEGLAALTPQVVSAGAAGTDTSGVEEYDLDTQYAAGVAGDVAALYLYDATALDDADLYDAYSDFVTPPSGSTTPLAQDASASFGECEDLAYEDGAMAADDALFATADLQNQTVFVASGDLGGDCAADTAAGQVVPAAGVSYPASSPFVTAVGGTALTTAADGSYGSEQGWASSGGGISTFEPQPPWQPGDGFSASQVTAVCNGQNAALPVPTSCGRTVPDVAHDADPDVSPVDVIYDGVAVALGGTSLSAPVTLGLWARLESSQDDGLGFAPPILYSLAGTSFFHDETTTAAPDVGAAGTNPYPSGTGYDLVTGLGSFDFIDAEQLLGTPPTAPPTSVPESPWLVGLPIAGGIGIAFTVRQRRLRASRSTRSIRSRRVRP